MPRNVTQWLIAAVLFGCTSLYGQDSSYTPGSRVRSNLEGYKPSRFHFSISYGRSMLHERENVIKAYQSSGYIYSLASVSDPGRGTSKPKTVSLSFEYAISSKFLIIAQVSNYFGQNLAGSNWVKSFEETRTIPEDQYDVTQKFRSRIYEAGIRYLIIPLNIHSRMEVGAGSGFLINTLDVKGKQKYARRPSVSRSTLYDVTSEKFNGSGQSLGMYADMTFDFYWSKFVSSQLRLEGRICSGIRIPSKSFEYVNTKTGTPRIFTHTLNAQNLFYSGYILSTSIHFHL